MNEPLYDANGVILRQREFQESLKLAGIRQGDIIFVHSDIGSFGKLLASNRNILLGSLVKALQNAVGKNGTIIMPTFSYSIEKKEVFDPGKSKSAVGALTEFFRKQKNVLRSLHPTHSVAVWGKLKREFTKKDYDTFGGNSVFSELCKRKGKIVFLGAPFQSLTFVHHIEQMRTVPYRNLVKINGKMLACGKVSDCEIEYYEKYSCFFTSLAKFEDCLIKKGIMKKIKVGCGSLMVADSVKMFEEGSALLSKNIYFFLRNDGIFGVFNTAAYPIIKYAKPAAKFMDIIFSRFVLKKQL
jgi:aminoglycoside 3-N-acetyltransferase